MYEQGCLCEGCLYADKGLSRGIVPREAFCSRCQKRVERFENLSTTMYETVIKINEAEKCL